MQNNYFHPKNLKINLPHPQIKIGLMYLHLANGGNRPEFTDELKSKMEGEKSNQFMELFKSVFKCDETGAKKILNARIIEFQMKTSGVPWLKYSIEGLLREAEITRLHLETVLPNV